MTRAEAFVTRSIEELANKLAIDRTQKVNQGCSRCGASVLDPIDKAARWLERTDTWWDPQLVCGNCAHALGYSCEPGDDYVI